MFGESESESPRVPSPWDSLMSLPPSPVPRPANPSPFTAELIPRLVPEQDDGNVEYKLQLLNPSPARFARLVTQMKWRLLEGGGQAYYELGVADSGDLIGLVREELEQSLETLEMMAGEIGASVIVVKEIEVPAAMASLAEAEARRSGARRGLIDEDSGGYSTGTTETETETEESSTDAEGDDLSLTVVLEKPRFAVDLEIASVFKPRPVRTRVHNHPHYAHSVGGKSKRAKKHKPPPHVYVQPQDGTVDPANKAHTKRQGRDRRREEKKKSLEARALQGAAAAASVASVETVVEEPTPVATVTPSPVLASVPLEVLAIGEDGDGDDDVFASPHTPKPMFAPTSSAESHLDVDPAEIEIVSSLAGGNEQEGEQQGKSRLIVEALVVRKMSIDEAFLDFGGFTLT
ncbi:hypothetical protein D9619_010583 [Psilocybe cf. subviscida]|uniref:GTP binding protein 2 n=1 Tax=Psilocybe cf. subviscida TaxID=2480587 RepID=A0A8H5ATS8_9AGAR|nr:hypothetical protein D9619_010583 [Psilocybe cf. subviscida]